MAEAPIITTTDVPRSAPPIIPAEKPAPVARDTTVKFDAPARATPPPEKPAAVETKEEKQERIYKQAEVDEIANKIRKNTEYRTRRELKAYYEGRESARTPEKQEPAPKIDKEPTRDDYQDWDTFSAARSDWVARKAVREESERIAKERMDRDAAEARDKKMAAFREKTVAKYGDIQSRIEAVADVELSQDVADVIAESDYGPEIFNHLVSNQKDLERISKLPPNVAAREIGRLEARFESESKKPETPEPPKPSAAPAPIEPVTGGKSAIATTAASDKDDMVTFAKKRNAAEAARKGLSP